MLTSDQLRQRYLEYFKDRGHAILPSTPLVPDNDPTTLFTGSGMQPMMPYLLGAVHPKGTRLVDSQKCFRSQDIEEVGDNRHTTCFEMIGNWSLGDYFKEEQLEWFFSFLTEEVGLDPQRLFVTVFRGQPDLGIPRDEEAVQIWQKLFQAKGIRAEAKDNPETLGMQDGRIFYYDETKNWWSRAGAPSKMPIGEPGGPDSEVFYDFGPELKLHEQSAWADAPCHVNCDCGRFLEIGNNVFMTYLHTEEGFEPLKQKNIDFGGGLERILAAHYQNPDVFVTDLFQPIIRRVEELSGRSYETGDTATKHAFRVIADHLRAAVMLAADGVLPSNKEQGYVARRLVRRAIRYGRQLGIERAFVGELVPLVAKIYEEAYPVVTAQLKQIQAQLDGEERKFTRTLAKGLKEFERMLNNRRGSVGKPETNRAFITPQDAFTFYETYGFPIELTLEMAKEKEIDFGNEDDFIFEFNQLKKDHADKSRSASVDRFRGGLADHSEATTRYHTATHLLQAALRQVLGTHVQQKGSNITAERLRFDFSHTQALTSDEMQQVERLINEWVADDLPVTKQTQQKQAALDSGAIAFFLEKYPDEVTVYTIGRDPDSDWISKEFCGGPHVATTAEIGQIKLIKDQSVATGVRRVYAQFKS